METACSRYSVKIMALKKVEQGWRVANIVSWIPWEIVQAIVPKEQELNK